MSYLLKIKQLITDGFPSKWWETFQLEIENNSNKKEKFDEFSQEICLRQDSIYEFLNSSVLAGEYVSESNFEGLVTDIITALDSIPSFIPPDPEAQTLIQEELIIDFIESLKLSLNHYTNLFVNVKLRYEIDHRDFVFYDNSDINLKYHGNDYSDETNQNLEFFNQNIQLARLDHFLTPDRPPFNQLLAISILLRSQLAGNRLTEVLKNKCDFLISKWLLRRVQLRSAPIYRIKDNREVEINVEKDFQSGITLYWREYIETHYEISPKWKFEITQKFDRLKNKSIIDLKLCELHILVKYYKDVAHSLENLKKIRLEIHRRYTNSLANGILIDIYSHSLAVIYAINNEFSLLLSKSTTDIKIADDFYTEIQQFQTASGNNNFFAQYKYLQFLTSKLRKEYNDRRALEFIAPAREIINKCDEIFEVYKENISWSTGNYNYVFQLPFDECKVEISNSNLETIFIASSFVLPLSKEKYRKEFEENRNEVNVLKASIAVFENIEKDMSSFNKMKDDIKRSEIRSMEILAVFATVITFVAGSITAFKTVNTLYEGFLLMFALATSLSFFVLLILTLNRGKKKLKQSINILIAFLVLSFLAWGLLFIYDKPTPIKQDENSATRPVTVPSTSSSLNFLGHSANDSSTFSEIKAK